MRYVIASTGRHSEPRDVPYPIGSSTMRSRIRGIFVTAAVASQQHGLEPPSGEAIE